MTPSFNIQSLRDAYLSGALSVSGTIQETLRRIRHGDSKIWINVDSEERLLAQAAELEARDPLELPLYGVPFAVKDDIDVAALPTTAGCPDFRYFASEDATVVANLRAAGAIPIGKTNLDPFSVGLAGVRSSFGTPLNASDPNHIPGGSSSGSAVSVALGQVSFSLGTDNLGAGVPASFNSVFGLKPTRGLLSNSGVVPGCRSLDSVSIYAANASDLQTVFRNATSFDLSDPYSRRSPNDLNTQRRIFVDGITFGVPQPEQLQFFGDTEFQELYLKSLARLNALGFKRRAVDFSPLCGAGRLLANGPWVAERYWAVHELIRSSPDSIDIITRAAIERGADATAVDVFEANYKLQGFRQLCDLLWDEVEFLAVPTTATRVTLAQAEADPTGVDSKLGFYTNFLNGLDLCSVAIPTDVTANGFPFGISLIAPAFHDEKVLSLADKLHQARSPDRE